jgi:hypothetical protein|tara:strand:- start:31392 stop:31526 length:135 start_codon:yes stop_codon:yes gene_type:complete
MQCVTQTFKQALLEQTVKQNAVGNARDSEGLANMKFLLRCGIVP